MKAKSDVLAARRQEVAAAPPTPSEGSKLRRPTARLPAAQRRAQIQSKAFEFFAEYGLTAQTRALADACGVSQRLLYSAFPNKAALINAVYDAEIAGPFKAIWFVQLRDRQQALAQRLQRFYLEYYETILTRRWLRLFLYASLAEAEMAPTYIADIIRDLLDIIVEEAAFDAGLAAPEQPEMRRELGWVLHGNISHLAIRRHIYRDSTPLAVDRVIAMHVVAFLTGVPGMIATLSERGQIAAQPDRQGKTDR